MNNETATEVLAAMIELQRDLAAAREEAGKHASAHAHDDHSYRVPAGVSVGFERALTILRSKMAACRRDAGSPI
jgi:hypothetical protein